MDKKAYSRRNFMHVCSAAVAMLSTSATAMSASLSVHERALLIDTSGKPLRAEALEPEREYVFFYPYLSTPVFLLDLGKPAPASTGLQTEEGRQYRWRGGVGPKHSIVAFCAICAHKMSHPSSAVSFIGYRKEPVGFLDRDKQVVRRSAVIQCCSEHSIYDPAAGAKVLAGPASQPLTAIDLDYENGLLYATGVYGGDLYERFFEHFSYRLALEFGPDRVRQKVSGEAVVMVTEDYTRQRIQC